MFANRKQAGKLLFKKLSNKKATNLVVLGIPRGGVIVAKEISKRFNIPLGVVVTKKISAPKHEELAIGAISEGKDVVLDNTLIKRLKISKKSLDEQIKDAERRVKLYKSKFKTKLNIKNKNIILVDDGIATGSTVEVAIKYLNKKGAKKIILAIPITPEDTVLKMKKLVDELVVLETPRFFNAVGEFYEDFKQASDKEVIQLLHNDRKRTIFKS